MSLEAKIDALIVALNENTAARKGEAAATPAAADKPKPPAKAKGPTKDDLTAAAKAFASQHGKPAWKALLGKFGATDLNSVAEKDYAAVIAASQEAPVADKPEAEDDGL